MSEITEGGMPQNKALEINRTFIEDGWNGSAEEPVINWPTEDLEDGKRYTVVLSSDGNYYHREGNAKLPTDAENVKWRKVYELRDKKWQVVEE